MTRRTDARGQANLAALAVALVALVSATTLGVVVADGSLANADRDPETRRAAVSVADRFVTADATTVRPNVVDGDALPSFTAVRLDGLAPPVAGLDVRVAVGDQTVVSRGSPTDGLTVRRVVLVATRTERTRSLAVADGTTATLPRRSHRLELRFGSDATVQTVRANGRVVLHDPDGLDGVRSVRLSRYETTTLAFAGGSGEVEVTSFPRQSRKAVLEVTVDG